MISALYGVLLALLICGLSLNVIKARRKNKVIYADGDCKELIVARTAQSNAVDYIPVTLILLLLLELNGGNVWLIHAVGIVFVTGRVVHARGIINESLKGRVLGMQITLYTIFALCFLNIVYLPFEKLLM